jgi:zearalenone synthase (nonreducing iterative type I polyketide synthase)
MATTILLFGDQTDPWVAGIEQLQKAASSTPWLQLFLDDLADVIKTEVKATTIDAKLQDALGNFSSLQELGEKYRNITDELGVVRTLLLHTVRTGFLLQWVKREPDLLNPNRRAEWLGLSGGLISLAALAISRDFDSLYDACLEVTRVLVRFCKFTSVRSRAVEDGPGNWGWAVLGIPKDDLAKTLDQFQQSMGIHSMKRAKVGVTGAGWSTIIGPPSVLELFIKQCPTVKSLAKNPLDIHALQHTLNISHEDLDYMVGNNSTFLSKPLACSNHRIWGLDDPEATYTNWGDLLRAVCSQVLSRPLDITQVFSKLNAKLAGNDVVRVIQMGSSSHASYLAATLKAARRDVLVQDERLLLHGDDGEVSSPPSGRIAIVGMAGRGPGCDNVDELWDLIISKQDLCQEVPKDRFDIDDYFCPEHKNDDRKCTMTGKFGCFMNKPGNFDSRFFHISPREAIQMDPGHRQFLMSTYEALEMAGYSDGQTRTTDPHRIAAFYGQCNDDWHETAHAALGCDAYTLQGIQRAFGPGRLAWQFKWEGPTYSLDSACASTTSAIHLACMSLLSKDIDMAVSGAGNILSTPHSFTCCSKAGILSDTGNCKTYRDDADGYARGDFAGAVVLKRLEDAVAHNDNILAVIASSGRNHSGNATSITNSDPGAQERLFRKVMRKAHVSPDDISYVEMHGTGTQTGDPAEMSAVTNIFKHRQLVDEPVAVGSCKANVGHSEAAAGMAELLKCISMFQKDTIPPQAGMPHALNPKFPSLSEQNIIIPSESMRFHKKQEPRRILLNNFDAAGGNACMILEDYVSIDKKHAVDPRSCHVIATSARTQASHRANQRKLVEWLRENPDSKIEDVAYTTTARRMHHPFRSAYAASTVQELITKLNAEIETSDTTSSALPSSQSSPIVFVFTGQGSHYAGMGCELYNTSPAFYETVNLCVSICEQYGFPPFLSLITNTNVDMSTMSTAQTQLAVLTLEIGLAAFWESIGLQASTVMGHSLGEYAALHVAGVLSLADVLYLVGQRALLLLERYEEGSCAMLAVSLSVTAVQDFLKSRSQYSSCAVACINSSNATVISGTADQIDELRRELTIPSKVLSVPFAFHSMQMDPILAEYISLAEGVTYSAPKIPVASTLLGSVVDTAGTFNGQYLGQQTRQAVNFVGALNAVKLEFSDPLWVELGPNQVCSSFIRATFPTSSSSKNIMSTLEAPGVSGGAWGSISKCITAAYTHGIGVDWLAFHAPYERCLNMLTLPSYAWDMKEYWISYVEPNKGTHPSPHPAVQPAKTEIISTCAQYVVQESLPPNKVQVTFSASLAEPGFNTLIDGHRMEHIPIVAGSVFCEAAFAAVTYTLKSLGRGEDANIVKLALLSPTLSRPLTKNLVGSDGELLTTVVMEGPSSDNIRVSWKAAPSLSSSEHRTSYDIGSCTVAVCNNLNGLQASWDRVSYFVKTRMDEIIQTAKEGHGHRFHPDIFYSLFSHTVDYGPTYKSVKEAYISSDFSEAAAEVVLPENPFGTKFIFSPYWGDSIVHLAGFTVNSDPRYNQTAAGTSFINSGFEKFEQTAALEAGKTYYTFVRVLKTGKDTRTCEVYVFNSDYMLVAQCFGLRFHQINNGTLRQTLSVGKLKPPSPPNNNDDAPKVIQKKEPATVLQKTIEPQKQQDAEEITATPGIVRIVLESIAEETGVEMSELTDETAVADLGVDSIMAIEVTSRVTNATGIDLLPSFLMEHPTIGDIRRAFGAASPSTPNSESGSLNDDTPESSISSEDATELVNNDLKVEKLDVPVGPEEIRETSIVTAQKKDRDDDSSPAPRVRITLLHGRPATNRQGQQAPPPFYMIADGTGTIASYIHIPAFINSQMPFYGIDSPFLHCPSRLTVEVGISGIAKLIVKAMVDKQAKGVPFWVGGFSGGAMIAYEVCRQLSAAGHVVEGLLLIDMCSPRSTKVHDNIDLGLVMFDSISSKDDSGIWNSTSRTHQHLNAVFACVAEYNPTPLQAGERPPAEYTSVIWAQKGHLERAHNPRLLQLMADQGIPTEAYPGFMEDPKMGAVAWSLLNKTSADLGPNGWERYVGKEKLLCLSIPADHLQMPTPGYVHLLGEAMEQSFSYFKQAAKQ